MHTRVGKVDLQIVACNFGNLDYVTMFSMILIPALTYYKNMHQVFGRPIYSDSKVKADNVNMGQVLARQLILQPI